MTCDVGEVTESLENEHNSFSNPSDASPTSHNSPTLLLLHLRHSSFSNPSVASPMSHLILQPFRFFTYVTAHSPTLLSLLIRHRLLTYVTWRVAHVPSPTLPLILPLLHPRHRSFSNHSVASPTSQLILQPFFRLSYVTGSSLTSPGEPPILNCKTNVGKT